MVFIIVLSDVLILLKKDNFVLVVDEFERQLFKGRVWQIDSNYLLSSPVVSIIKYDFIKIYVIG